MHLAVAEALSCLQGSSMAEKAGSGQIRQGSAVDLVGNKALCSAKKAGAGSSPTLLMQTGRVWAHDQGSTGYSQGKEAKYSGAFGIFIYVSCEVPRHQNPYEILLRHYFGFGSRSFLELFSCLFISSVGSPTTL